MAPTAERLWRVRRRQQSIDAILREGSAADGAGSAGSAGNEVTLEFVMNGRRVTSRRWPSRAQAVKAATDKRKELERAGWATHW
jgi:hypothetical protein